MTKKHPLQSLKEGDSVIYKNVGYGLVSYEPGEQDVIGIKKGKLFTNTFDSIGMEWDKRQQLWKFDSGLGLVTYAIPADDPKGLEGLKENE